MDYLAVLFLGVIIGLVISEFLPADMAIKLGKIKVKNSEQVELPLTIDGKPLKKPGLFKRIFKRKKKA